MIKAKILVIDDEKDFLIFMQEELALHGYEVVVASDGEEGLEGIRNHRPELVICDIRMPKQDGFYVLRNLRHSGDSTTPFIMMTAFDDFEHTRTAYSENADFYITKPVSMEHLLKNVQTLLSIKDNRL